MKTKKCVSCDNNFQGSRNAKYCSECKEMEKSCAECSKIFIWKSKASNRVTCSKDCGENRANIMSKIGRFIIFERDGFTCIYCGRNSIEDKIKLVVDHIHPKITKGKDTAGNLITACYERIKVASRSI